MKKILLTFVGFVFALSLLAVTATPYPLEIILPDGTTQMVKLVGDEYHSYYTTLDGTPLRKLDNGFFVEDWTVAEQSARKAKERRRVMASESMEMAAAYPVTGQPRSLVLLVSFQDVAFTESREDFDKLLNESGYSYDQATGSCRDYFIAASDSVFQPQFDVFGPFTLDKKMEYYGAPKGYDHDSNPKQMIIDACLKAEENGVNFADYDMNEDGVVDNVFVYYAGHNQAEGASENTVWPHQWNLSTYNIKVSGKRLNTYACTSEYSGKSGNRRASIGTFCHEFGHVLGLPDLYDTDYKYYTVSNWSIMCSGNYNNKGRTPPTYSAYERFYLGWLKPEQLLDNGMYYLSSLEESNSAYLLAKRKHNLYGFSPDPTEFFMFEYRTKQGWDTYLPGQGMLVWHIDYSREDWARNNPNSAVDGYLRIHLEEANGVLWNNRQNGDEGRPTDVYPGSLQVRTFTPKLHDGTTLSDQSIFDITETDGHIRFIYKSLGDVQMTADVQSLSLTTTVSDEKKIVDWQPQRILLKTENLLSDTITIETKQSFYVVVADSCPSRGSSAWKRKLIYEVPEGVTEHTVWVSFVPQKQSCDEILSSLNIATLGASVPIKLYAYSPRPIYVTAPELKPVENITPYSFQVDWKPVEDAVVYYMTLYTVDEGNATYTQGFENFSSMDVIAQQGWDANTTRTTTSAKADGVRSLLMKSTGDYVASEEYISAIQSVSFWVNAFYCDSLVAGYVDLDVWNGTEWLSLPECRTEVLRTTKAKTITVDFGTDTQYYRVRLRYTDVGGSGIALDAFKATCAQNINFIHRGKELVVDAMPDEEACSYEFTGLESNTTYFCSMQSSDITKGCVENLSPLSAPIEVTTKAVNNDEDDKDNRLPIVVERSESGSPIVRVYISTPVTGDMLNVYSINGAVVMSIPIYTNVIEYVIPTSDLLPNTLYLIKHIEAGRLKRKQQWAKFVL
jgi:M6 family metalloprotease-like protein